MHSLHEGKTPSVNIFPPPPILIQHSPLSLITRQIGSSGNSWLLLLSIKSCDKVVGAGPSRIVCVYGCKQHSSGSSLQECSHRKRFPMGTLDEEEQPGEPAGDPITEEVQGALCKTIAQSM
ncbi:hypothetical protein AB205_0218760 [Aquarana catesbeiana]|uniref:Uncharacterized protein n=1 Tax=Aquarana catesbeiana TaxID=8400 RepID=A0A2G9P360_AQUCT|nr:hypothetical protein AB205_0218760 [Aquarana catesbeiana]PIN97766.1 hypothetical protein AB205_0218760 [Aquarana catesbeiana]